MYKLFNRLFECFLGVSVRSLRKIKKKSPEKPNAQGKKRPRKLVPIIKFR